MKNTYTVRGYKLELVETAETDANYTELDVTHEDGEVIGQLTKYNGEKRWTAWDSEGEEIAKRADKKGCIEKILIAWMEN